MPTIRLTDDAIRLLQNYSFKGNIRQLRNITEQLSVIEKNRLINALTLQEYLPSTKTNLPSVIGQDKSQMDFANEREIFYKIMLDMRSDINDLKKLTLDLMQNNGKVQENNEHLIRRIYNDFDNNTITPKENKVEIIPASQTETYHSNYEDTEIIEPSISLQEKEEEMIKASLERNNGKRKLAAKELGISERTLYRKIKQYDL
jgi:DNA-binding NtrC family response regulator